MKTEQYDHISFLFFSSFFLDLHTFNLFSYVRPVVVERVKNRSGKPIKGFFGYFVSLLLLLIAFIERHSPLSSKLTALACDST